MFGLLDKFAFSRPKVAQELLRNFQNFNKAANLIDLVSKATKCKINNFSTATSICPKCTLLSCA